MPGGLPRVEGEDLSVIYSDESVRQAVQRVLGRIDSPARAAEVRRSPSGDAYVVSLEMAGRSGSVSLPADLVQEYLDSDEQAGGLEWTRILRRAVTALEGGTASGAAEVDPAKLKAAEAAVLMGMDKASVARKQGIPLEALESYLRSRGR